MAIVKSWSHTTKDYLVQLITDWMTNEGVTGTVTDDLGPQLTGTITDPYIYVNELDNYPHHDDDNTLLVGYKIVWKYNEIDYDEAMEQLTDTIYSLCDYLQRGVKYMTPVIGGIRPPWIAHEISDPIFNEIYNKRRGYLNNEVEFGVVYRLAVTKRGWHFPQRFVGG